MRYFQGNDSSYWAFNDEGYVTFKDNQCTLQEFPRHPNGEIVDTQIHEDDKGRIWVAWEGDLTMFDRGETRSFGIALDLAGLNNSATATLDEEGRLWVSTFSAFLRFNQDLTNYEVFSPSTMNILDREEGRLFGDRVFFNDEGIWLAASDGPIFTNLERQPWTYISQSGTVRRFRSSPDGSLNFSNWGLHRLSEQGLSFRDRNNSEIPLWYIRDFLFDEQGNIDILAGESFRFQRTIDSIATLDDGTWTLQNDIIDPLELKAGDDFEIVP